MNITKAEQVEQAYDAALRDNLYSKDCYAAAINPAVALGGIEMATINMSETCASKISYDFDDLSKVQIKYGSVFVIC